MTIEERRFILIGYADTFVPELLNVVRKDPDISDDDLEEILHGWILAEVIEYETSGYSDVAECLKEDTDIVIYDAMEILKEVLDALL